jgi:hypothetical protein
MRAPTTTLPPKCGQQGGVRRAVAGRDQLAVRRHHGAAGHRGQPALGQQRRRRLGERARSPGHEQRVAGELAVALPLQAHRAELGAELRQPRGRRRHVVARRTTWPGGRARARGRRHPPAPPRRWRARACCSGSGGRACTSSASARRSGWSGGRVGMGNCSDGVRRDTRDTRDTREYVIAAPVQGGGDRLFRCDARSGRRLPSPHGSIPMPCDC